MAVENKLTNDGSKLGVELNFTQIDDFDPDRVVQQVEPLRRLVRDRQRLSDLLSKMDGNDKLESGLEEILKNSEKQQQLGSELGIDSDKKEDAPKEESK